MVFSIVFSIISAILSVYIYIASGFYQYIYLFFLPLIMFPLIYLLCFGVFIIIVFIWSLFIDKKKETKKVSKLYYWFVKETCFLLVQLSNTKLHITGLEKIDRKKRNLVISNHISNFDPIVSLVGLKLDPIICVSKPSNMKIPIAGAFIHKAGFIPIDRENDRNAAKSIIKATKFIQNNESSVYICPEGTRSKSLELLEFKAGAFKIATRSNAPIVVLAIKNSHKIVKNFPFKRTHVYIDVLEVINPEDYENKNTIEISEYCKSLILENQNKYKEN